MKILEAVEGRSNTGPAAAALLSARALAGRGHSVTWLCAPGTSLAGRAASAGLEVIPELERSPTGPLGWAGLLREHSRNADVVHVHRSRSHLAALLGLGFSKRSRPLIRTCHAGRPGQLGRWSRWVARHADGLVVRSTALTAEMQPSAPPGIGQLAVIPGGADGGVFRPGLDASGVRAQLDMEDRTLVGTVAHLKPGRQLMTFCRAAEMLCRDPLCAGLAFLLLGRGRLGKEIRPWAVKAGIADRLRTVDPGTDFPAMVAALDIGVLLVPGSDGSGRAALEMAALGKPLVLGDIGALADLAGAHGECARLVPPGSADALAAAVRELAVDGELRRRLGAAAHQRFEERHALERLGENYERFLAAVAGGGA
jgi:glycosyltransferase involved in cell wall biosynthesis